MYNGSLSPSWQYRHHASVFADRQDAENASARIGNNPGSRPDNTNRDNDGSFPRQQARSTEPDAERHQLRTNRSATIGRSVRWTVMPPLYRERPSSRPFLCAAGESSRPLAPAPGSSSSSLAPNDRQQLRWRNPPNFIPTAWTGESRLYRRPRVHKATRRHDRGREREDALRRRVINGLPGLLAPVNSPEPEKEMEVDSEDNRESVNCTMTDSEPLVVMMETNAEPTLAYQQPTVEEESETQDMQDITASLKKLAAA